MTFRAIAGMLLVVAAAPLAAACTSSPSSSGAATASSPAAPGSSAAASGETITTGHSSLGAMLTDGEGKTVYYFEKDTGTASTCYGGCAQAWPPVVTSGPPVAAGGVKANLLGTIKRNDGTLQVTYNGHPLYYFAGDGKPGDINGEDISGFGAKWYVLSTSGVKIEKPGS